MRFHTFGLGRGVSVLLAALSAAYLNNIKARLWRNLNRWGWRCPLPPTFITNGTYIAISMHSRPDFVVPLQMDQHTRLSTTSTSRSTQQLNPTSATDHSPRVTKPPF